MDRLSKTLCFITNGSDSSTCLLLKKKKKVYLVLSLIDWLVGWLVG